MPARLVTLTQMEDRSPLVIRARCIVSVKATSSGRGSVVTVRGPDRFTVSETPTQVAELIEKADPT